MAKGEGPILTEQQLADYEEMGFLHSIPILSQDEVDHYRTHVEKTCQAIGGRATRLDGLHLFFRWAWELSTHPRLLNSLEQLLGSTILLKSTRLFYKYGGSASYVGWHQDGITEILEDGRAPAVWLGLTAATVENGCLRVVPRSHRFGLLQHSSKPDLKPLPGADTSDQVQSWSGDELSGRIASLPSSFEDPFDLVMRPGDMSIHHPLILHGSNPNVSSEPRIGLSASYSTPELYNGRSAVVCRGDSSREHYRFEVINKPAIATLDAAASAYCASDRQILFAAL
jgi:non-heme Fe2+,alpha-ketoglutarate-dependent halogenase